MWTPLLQAAHLPLWLSFRSSGEVQRTGCSFLRKGVEAVVKDKVREFTDEAEPIGKKAVCLLSSPVLQHWPAGVQWSVRTEGILWMSCMQIFSKIRLNISQQCALLAERGALNSSCQCARRCIMSQLHHLSIWNRHVWKHLFGMCAYIKSKYILCLLYLSSSPSHCSIPFSFLFYCTISLVVAVVSCHGAKKCTIPLKHFMYLIEDVAKPKLLLCSITLYV